MSDGFGRTDEEREAARLQRERRRAARAARDAPAQIEREPRPQVAGAAAEPPAADPLAADPLAADPLAADPLADDPPEEPAGTKRVSRLQLTGVAERPARGRRATSAAGKGPAGASGTAGRSGAAGASGALGAAGGSGAGQPPAERPSAPRERRPRRPAGPARKRKHSVAGRIAGLLTIVLALAVVWFVYELFQPFHGSGHGSVKLTIPAHASADQVGSLLQHDGVISSSFFFKLRATVAGERSDLRSGTYELKRGMSYGSVLKILTTPPPAAKVSELTLIEGKSRAQVDALLRAQHVRGSYVVATRHSKLLDPHDYGAPRSTPDLEGFLFPSTYQLREPISIDALVADQLKTFRTEFRKVNLGYARSKHLTPYDVLKIASMVQTEAETAHDAPLVASVIYNRLRDNMPLQIDATTRFATGNYKTPLTDSQLNSSSPYNTRNHKGLPPTPIDSPGLAAIDAAAHPARTNDLYFVGKVCGNGEMVFASSFSQFEKDEAKYQQARTNRGGRSPEQC